MTTEQEILKRSAVALDRAAAAKRALQEAESEVQRMCRELESVTGARGLAPYHLAASCRALRAGA